MSPPKVSICIPAYRQPEALRRALKSVVAQVFQGYEVVITDDSPDDSIESLVKEFSTDPRIKYCKNSQRLGTPENWNEAVSMASGEYIKVLHHDDWFHAPDSLGNFVKLLDENPAADFAFGASWNYSEDYSLVGINSPGQPEIDRAIENPKVLLSGNIVGSPSATIYRRGIGIRFDPELKWLVDVDFYISALSRNKIIAFSDSATVCVGLGSERVTNECGGNMRVEISEAMHVYRKSHSKFLGLPEDFRYFCLLFERFHIVRITDAVAGRGRLRVPLVAWAAFFRVRFRVRVVQPMRKIVAYFKSHGISA